MLENIRDWRKRLVVEGACAMCMAPLQSREEVPTRPDYCFACSGSWKVEGFAGDLRVSFTPDEGRVA